MKENEALAKLYESVFADPPWNEFKTCTGKDCSASFGRETEGADYCPCPKRAMLAPFYPRRDTLAYIEEETEEGSTFLKIENDEIIGFAWGYEIETNELILKKYKTEEMRQGITGLLERYGIKGKVFYFSETGVRQDFRGRGISNRLAEQVIAEAKNKYLPLIMRTNWQSPMVSVAERFGMKQIMGPAAAIKRNGKTTTTKKTRRIVNGFLDSEIEDRVLFMLQ